MIRPPPFFFFFFFNDTATTEIYTLSLHDALPICTPLFFTESRIDTFTNHVFVINPVSCQTDRKSTRLNSSHSQISYAVFCLKKKKKKTQDIQQIKSNIHVQTTSLRVAHVTISALT